MAPILTRSLRPAFRALASAFVPEIAAASGEEWAALEDTFEHALAVRPPALRRQITSFIRLLDLTARLRFGARLAALNEARRGALLESFADSRLPLLRRGVWGLRTLIMLGWYTQPAVIASLGYRAAPAGWAARA